MIFDSQKPLCCYVCTHTHMRTFALSLSLSLSHTHTHTHIFSHIHVHICARTHVHICTHTHTHARTFAHSHMRTFALSLTHINTRACAHLHTHTHVRTFACTSVCHKDSRMCNKPLMYNYTQFAQYKQCAVSILLFFRLSDCCHLTGHC